MNINRHYFSSIFFTFFISACVAPYNIDTIESNIKIRKFENTYSQTSKKTDSIFEVFKDEELKNLISTALKNNKDITIYDNRIKIASIEVNSAFAKQFPNLDGNLSYSFNKDSNIDISIMTSWELDMFGKMLSNKNAKEELYKQAKENLDYFKISLISDIALSYFNIKQLQLNISTTTQRINNYYDLLYVMDNLYANGFIDFANYLDNKNYLQQEKQALNTLLNTYETEKNNLRILINDMNYKISDSKYEFSMPNFYVNINNSIDIILNRPDIKAQIFNLNAAIFNLNAAKADLYPSIKLSGSISKTLLSPNGISNLAYQILSSLTMPILNRQTIYNNIKINDYMRLESYFNLEKSIYKSLSEIDNAIFTLESNKKTLKISQEMLNANTEILEVLKYRKEMGLVDIIEYLQALNSNLSMIQNNNTAYFNTISAAIYLYRSIGGNLEDTKI